MKTSYTFVCARFTEAMENVKGWWWTSGSAAGLERKKLISVVYLSRLLFSLSPFSGCQALFATCDAALGSMENNSRGMQEHLSWPYLFEKSPLCSFGHRVTFPSQLLSC